MWRSSARLTHITGSEASRVAPYRIRCDMHGVHTLLHKISRDNTAGRRRLSRGGCISNFATAVSSPCVARFSSAKLCIQRSIQILACRHRNVSPTVEEAPEHGPDYARSFREAGWPRMAQQSIVHCGNGGPRALYRSLSLWPGYSSSSFHAG